MAEEDAGKVYEGAGGIAKATVFTKVLERIDGKHIFPGDIIAYYKNKKIDQCFRISSTVSGVDGSR